MGLDMYLTGSKFLFQNWTKPHKDRKEDGFVIESVRLRLGYWRKHPDLHGFIVNTFAEGRDECQPIELTSEDMIKIVEAVRSGTLPPTTGFFFGESEDTQLQRDEDIDIFERAIGWLDKTSPLKPKQVALEHGVTMVEISPEQMAVNESRSVIYQASW